MNTEKQSRALLRKAVCCEILVEYVLHLLILWDICVMMQRCYGISYITFV